MEPSILDPLLAALTSEAAMKVAFSMIGGSVPVLIGLSIYYRNRRAYQKGDMKDVCLMMANIFEEGEDGEVLMKPRTVHASRPVAEVFPNPVLAKQIVAAARGSDVTIADKSFLMLEGEISQRTLAKKVVDQGSQLAAEGHLWRMFGGKVILNEAYACITLAQEGDFETIRIDIINREDLRRFLGPNFRASLAARPGENSHDDMAEIFEICARDVFDPDDPLVERPSSRAFRVSLPFRA